MPASKDEDLPEIVVRAGCDDNSALYCINMCLVYTAD